MKTLLLISLLFLASNTFSQEIPDEINLHKRPVKERAENIYSSICKYGRFEEDAFMGSQLQPTIRTIFLKRLPDTVASEVKKLKPGEFTKPIYVGESCFIIKLIQKKFIKYKLNIIYFENHSKPIYELPKKT